MSSKTLNAAGRNKEDEFYTQISDIEAELRHYKEHFVGKTVLCNCDDPRVSNFFKFFSLNFKVLGLKRLITTCYKNQQPDLFSEYASEQAVYLIYDGKKNTDGEECIPEIDIKPLKGDGDFRSPECVNLLKQADIVVTNPPFSLFRQFIDLMIKYKKKFLIIGNHDAMSYKEVFPLLKNNIIWLGTKAGDMKFRVPSYYPPRKSRYWVDEAGQKWRSHGNICWYTNLDYPKRHEEMALGKKFWMNTYKEFDNYKAIDVDAVKDIPGDYFGPMGVPVTFMSKYNPEQFEILNANDYRRNEKVPIKAHGLIKDKDGSVDGKPKFVRILIRLRKEYYEAKHED